MHFCGQHCCYVVCVVIMMLGMRVSGFYIFSLCLLGVVLLFFFAVQSVYAVVADSNSPQFVSDCLTLTSPAEKHQCYVAICGDVSDTTCIFTIVTTIAASDIPLAMTELAELLENDVFTTQQSGWEFASGIGFHGVQSGARADFGALFLSCTDAFYDGCYYGFFSGVLPLVDTDPLEAALAICGTAEQYSQEDCYTVMGRVFMTHTDSQVDAFALCDALSEDSQQRFCRDGVIQEEKKFADASSADASDVDTSDAVSVVPEVSPSQQLSYSPSRSWWQRLLEFILSLFSGG